MIQRIIDRLANTVTVWQSKACKPYAQDKSIEYEAGYRVGVHQGLIMAMDAITSLYKDEAAQDNDL